MFYSMVRDEAMSIFVSYRRGVDSASVLTLVAALRRKFGARAIFHDTSSPLLDGKLKGRLLSELARSQACLVAIGAGWSTERMLAQNDFVRFEIETALSLNELAIIPVLLDDTPMPTSESMPNTVRALGDYAAVRVDFRASEATVDQTILSKFLGNTIEAPVGFSQLCAVLDRVVVRRRSLPLRLRPALLATIGFLFALSMWGPTRQVAASCAGGVVQITDSTIDNSSTIINGATGGAKGAAEP